MLVSRVAADADIAKAPEIVERNRLDARIVKESNRIFMVTASTTWLLRHPENYPIDAILECERVLTDIFGNIHTKRYT